MENEVAPQPTAPQPNAVIPPSLAVMDDTPTPIPIPPAPPTMEELMNAMKESVEHVKAAQDLQSKYGFALTQITNPQTGQIEIVFLINRKGMPLIGL